MNERASLPALKREFRLRLLELLTVVLIATMGMMAVARYLMGEPLPDVVLLVDFCYGLLLLGVWRLAHRSRSLLLPGWLVLSGLLFVIFVASQAAGGLNAPIVKALPFLPMLAALLLGRRSLPWFGALIALCLLGLYGWQELGWIETPPWDESMGGWLDLLVVVMALLLCTGLGYHCDRQNDQMYEQLSRRANTDGLTGVANRRFFDERLGQEWLRNQRMNRPLSLLLVDIDYFKRYNDVYGHVEGDRCLIAVAQAIVHHCRRSGELVARYGGEEFAVILPNVDLAEAAVIADKLRLDIAELYGKGHPEFKEAVTVSIGYACVISQQFANQECFIVQADEALYRAKRSGRNQSVGAMVVGSHFQS